MAIADAFSCGGSRIPSFSEPDLMKFWWWLCFITAVVPEPGNGGCAEPKAPSANEDVMYKSEYTMNERAVLHATPAH